MEPPRNEWPTSEYGKHALFMAQTILECLSETNFESFRAPSLDNLTRLRELELSARQSLNSHQNRTNFRPMIEEITDTLSESIIAHAQPEQVELLIDKLNSFNQSNRIDTKNLAYHLKLFQDSIEGYFLKRLVNEMKLSFRTPKEKIRSKYVTREFLSFLINRGYDKRFIRYNCRLSFFQNRSRSSTRIFHQAS